MTRSLDGSILDQLGDPVVEDLARPARLRKVRVVPGVGLDADAPAALGHPEDERPPVLRVQVGVRQHEQALVLPQPQIILQILKYLPGVVLLHFGVRADAGRDDFASLQF